MKHIHLILFALLLSSAGLQAQNQFQAAINESADLLCDCVNKTFGTVDNDVKDVFVKMTTLGEEAGQEYFMSLDEETQMRFLEQSIQIMEKEDAFQTCIGSMETTLTEKYPYDFESQGHSEEDFIEGLMKRMAGSNDCSFAYFLMMAGMQGENPEIIEDNPTIKGGNSGHGGGNSGGNSRDSGEEGQ